MRDETEVSDEKLLGVMTEVARLLFVHGQTTQATQATAVRLGTALGAVARLQTRWGELSLAIDGGLATTAADPSGVDMRRVAAVEKIVDDVCANPSSRGTLPARLSEVARLPPLPFGRFVVMAAAGAAALGTIFGAPDGLTLSLIALSAAAGAALRFLVGHLSSNPLAPPLVAAVLAGLVAATVARMGLDIAHWQLAVCPCMILVPGPHILNGSIDLARARIALGAARVTFAAMIVLAICIGLLFGLSFGGATLPPPVAADVPLSYDAVAAGVAVASYGSYFNMPWKVLPIPIATGMLAHALRWVLLSHGASAPTGAFVACLLVGCIVTPIADWLRSPFAGFAFASVVSLMPGIFLFETASGLLQLLHEGKAASSSLLIQVVLNGTTAFAIVLAMTLGLILPKMLISRSRLFVGPVRVEGGATSTDHPDADRMKSKPCGATRTRADQAAIGDRHEEKIADGRDCRPDRSCVSPCVE